MRAFFWRQWYRFGLGTQFLGLINFVLLVVAVSKQLGFRALPALMVAVPVGLCCVLGWGYFLDRRMKAQETNERIIINRSPIYQNLIKQVEEIHKHLGLNKKGNQ